MDVRNRVFALYGRFSPGARDRLQRQILRGGGRVVRDLTRRSDVLVVGGLAMGLIDSGALEGRIRQARGRGVPVRGERAFATELVCGDSAGPMTLPVTAALSQTGLTREDVEILAAFDLIAVDGGACRFGDAGVIRSAGELQNNGRSRA